MKPETDASALDGVELRARSAADTAHAGRHRGRLKGVAGEFDGHRPYAPGDDGRRLDWRVFARSDRWVVRESRTDSRLRTGFFLDLSGSMAFSEGGRPTKGEYGAGVVRALARVVERQGDAAALGLLTDRLASFLLPVLGAEIPARFESILAGAGPSGPTRLGPALRDGLSRFARPGLSVVVSDFWPPSSDWLPVFREAVARGEDLIALQIHDPAERDPGPEGEFDFDDLETGQRLRVDLRDVAGLYARRVAERQARLTAALAAAGVDLLTLSTDRSAAPVLGAYLRRRLART